MQPWLVQVSWSTTLTTTWRHGITTFQTPWWLVSTTMSVWPSFLPTTWRVRSMMHGLTATRTAWQTTPLLPAHLIIWTPMAPSWWTSSFQIWLSLQTVRHLSLSRTWTRLHQKRIISSRKHLTSVWVQVVTTVRASIQAATLTSLPMVHSHQTRTAGHLMYRPIREVSSVLA